MAFDIYIAAKINFFSLNQYEELNGFVFDEDLLRFGI